MVGSHPHAGFVKDYSHARQYREELEGRSLLPFSKHREYIKLPSTYTFQIENLQIFKMLLEKISNFHF